MFRDHLEPVWVYVDRNQIAISQLVNTLIGGEPHETLSSHTWRRMLRGGGWGWFLVAAILELYESEHCCKAYHRACTRARLMEIERIPPI
jgi:hypothetical protein